MQLNLNKVALALAAAGVISGLAGCGGGSGISTSPFNNDPVKVSSQVNTVTLAFVDAITGAPITESVKVKLKGQSAGMLTTLTAANGTTSPLNDGIELDTTLSQDAKVPGTVTFLANFGSGGSFTATPDSSTWIAYPQTISKNGTVVFKLLKKKSNDTGTYVTAAGSGNVSNGDVSVVAPNDLGAAKITIKQDSSLGPLSVAVVKFADSKVNDLDATLTQGTFSLGDKPAMARFVVTDSNGKVIKDFPNGVTLQPR